MFSFFSLQTPSSARSSDRWKQKGLGLAALLCLLSLGSACFPPEHPEPEHPPCLKSITPDTTVKLELNSTFTLTFSKEMNAETITNGYVFLVDGALTYYEQRDLETPDSISDSLEQRLVPVDLQVISGNGEPTKVTVSPRRPLLGDRSYTLLITKGARDKFSRPLNRCADANGVSVSDVGSYKDGLSVTRSFSTQSSPGIPKIVEVQVNQPVSNGRFIEVMNLSSAKGALNLASYTLSGGGKARSIIFKRGNNGEPGIKPGEVGIIVEPDYDFVGNPLNIPSSVPIFTTTGSSSTMVDGGLSGKSTVSLRKASGDAVDTVSPSVVADGDWPKDKSLEKCDPDKGNDKSNWKASSDSTGTPGRDNGC